MIFHKVTALSANNFITVAHFFELRYLLFVWTIFFSWRNPLLALFQYSSLLSLFIWSHTFLFLIFFYNYPMESVLFLSVFNAPSRSEYQMFFHYCTNFIKMLHSKIRISIKLSYLFYIKSFLPIIEFFSMMLYCYFLLFPFGLIITKNWVIFQTLSNLYNISNYPKFNNTCPY